MTGSAGLRSLSLLGSLAPNDWPSRRSLVAYGLFIHRHLSSHDGQYHVEWMTLSEAASLAARVPAPSSTARPLSQSPSAVRHTAPSCADGWSHG